MLDIKEIKTRDTEVLNATIREMMNLDKYVNAIGDLEVLFSCVERMQCQTMIFFDMEIKQWVFTDVYDDYLVSQDYFSHMNFVIVETDLNLALARGIHYRYHKKGRE